MSGSDRRKRVAKSLAVKKAGGLLTDKRIRHVRLILVVRAPSREHVANYVAGLYFARTNLGNLGRRLDAFPNRGCCYCSSEGSATGELAREREIAPEYPRSASSCSNDWQSSCLNEGCVLIPKRLGDVTYDKPPTVRRAATSERFGAS